jgi:nucleotide-binding universal stress UspA family protein
MTEARNARTVLAATDLSAPARHAAGRAAMLAAQTGATLTLVHVVPASPLAELRAWLGAESDPTPALEQQARLRLCEQAEQLAKAHGIGHEAVLRTGDVLEEIEQVAQERAAEALVLGVRGEGFLRRLVLGTTAERLLRRTTRPVLVVRQLPHEPYRRVLVAVDFSPWSRHALAAALTIAPGARLLLFHAWKVPFHDKLQFAGVDAQTIEHYRRRARSEAGHAVHALAQAAGLNPAVWEPLVLEGDASQRLVEQEQERDIDLVVLGRHGRSAAHDLLPGSVTRHVLAEGTADLLVSTRRDD